MKFISRLAIVAVVSMLVAALPASAACPSSGFSFNTNGSYFTNNTGNDPTTPGSPVKGSFWLLHNGNPSGAGVDNGTYDSTQWLLLNTSPPYIWLGAADFGSPGVDGCADAVAAGSARGAMLITDLSTDGTTGVFSAVCVTENTARQYDLNNAGSELPFVSIPKPKVTRNPCSGPGGVTDCTVTNLTVSHQPLAGGVYTDGTCDGLIAGFKVYRISVPRGDPAPTTRDRAAWTALNAASSAIGGNVTGSVSCPTNQDVYLATSLVFDGSPATSTFETPYVSDTTTRVECGPQLAVTPPEFRNIRKPRAVRTQ